MPTHKDLPDSWLRSKPQRGPAGWSTRKLVVVIVCGGLAAGLVAGLLVSRNPERASGRDSSRVAARIRRRTRHARRAHRHARAEKPQRSPGRPSRRVSVFAVGVSLPGHGVAPDLIATTGKAGVVIRSRSPMPLKISYDSRHGQRLHQWATVQFGGSTSQIVITGRWYGYCFSQAAGDGYAATRGCAALTLHLTLNGARLPDGAAATRHFSFLRRG